METDRLIIDAIQASDKADYFHAISHDKKVLETFICRYAETLEDFDFSGYLGREGLFAIRLKETKRLIGIILYFDDTGDSCEIGYGIGSAYWGKGYATEAVGRFIRYCLDEKGFRTVYASFFTGNDASRRVMEKCGMTFSRFSPKELTYLGVERDLTYYSISKNKMHVKLIKLTPQYRQQLGEMIEEWVADQALHHTNGSPWAIFKNDYRDFDYYLAHLELKTPAEGRVPDSVFFLLDEDRNRLLGAVNIRHYLNDALLRDGGHIGDGIRPSERRKGYATEMVRLALIECKKLGIDKVLMVCDKDNVGSAKSIVRNGGVLENEFVDEDGKVEQRYWITL